MRVIRVLVVEDSQTVRHRLCEVLSADPGVEVAEVAATGHAAIDATRRVRPDVITMDIVLPGLSGLAAIEHIMAHFPTPIVVVSSAENRSEMFTTYDALAAGAVDVLEKPRGDASDGDWERRLLSTVKVVSRVPVITHPRAKLTTLRGSDPPPVTPPARSPASRSGTCELVAIGASTGGPGAVVEVLRGLRPDYPLPILLVQHISPPFADSFVDWLSRQIDRPVRVARDGEPVAAAAGRVIMAPADRHLVVRAGRLHLTADPERHSCRPSVDTLFESIAAAYASAAAGCLLTGMGRDGAAGLLAMRRAGALTLAQDAESSVVYGMPREAALLGAAIDVLAPADIGRRLATLAADGTTVWKSVPSP